MDNKNIPAFPFSYEDYSSGITITEPGMTLRDWFAGQALVGIISACGNNGLVEYEEDVVAENAFKVADAMLAAREK